MRHAALFAALLLAAACASPPAETPASPPSAPVAVGPAPPPIASPAPPTRDACGAADVQNLVGRPRTQIPVPVDPNRQRVACTTCPVTLDYRPDRLNFFFDADTGVIKEIKCG